MTPATYKRPSASKIQQAAILRDIDIPEVRTEPGRRAVMTPSRFAWLVVLTQDCDLELDHHARKGTSPRRGGSPVARDKMLRTVLLCPAFPTGEVLDGTYLRPIQSRTWAAVEKKILLQNRDERYYVLEPYEPFLAESITLDFKLVVGTSAMYLERWIRNHRESRVAVLQPPYRDHLAQRFAYYFTRVALP